MKQSITCNISYSDYAKQLEDLGWKKTYRILTQKDTDLVTIKSGKIAETSLIIDVKCPSDKLISIKGRQNINIFKESKYGLKCKFLDKENEETSPFTYVRITNETDISGLDILARLFYVDITNKNNIPYKFKDDVEIKSSCHLMIYVVAETPTGGPYLPDVDIDASHVIFSLGCDAWSKEGYNI